MAEPCSVRFILYGRPATEGCDALRLEVLREMTSSLRDEGSIVNENTIPVSRPPRWMLNVGAGNGSDALSTKRNALLS